MEDDNVTEYLDVGLQDSVNRHRRWEVEDDQGHTVTKNQCLQQPIPEDLMSALQEHIGDAMAKMTIGGELSHSKEYGCRAQSFVSISVHCNNDLDTLNTVAELLQSKVRELANIDLKQMMEDRDSYLESGAVAGKVGNPPAARAQVPGPKQPPRPPHQAAVPKVARPSFKR